MALAKYESVKGIKQNQRTQVQGRQDVIGQSELKVLVPPKTSASKSSSLASTIITSSNSIICTGMVYLH
jgi:hypothetical protein